MNSTGNPRSLVRFRIRDPERTLQTTLGPKLLGGSASWMRSHRLGGNACTIIGVAHYYAPWVGAPMHIPFGKLFVLAALLGGTLLVAACDPAPTPSAARTAEQGNETVVAPSTTTNPAPLGPTPALIRTSGAQDKAATESFAWSLLTITLALTTLVSVAVTAWLFRWRRKLPDGQITMVPEAFIKLAEQLVQANVEQIKSASQSAAEVRSNFSEIRSGFSVFSSAAASKDAEIERLRKGSDRQAYLQFVRRFVRVLRMTDADIFEDRTAGRDTSALESLRGYLLEALRDWGVETFSPPIGEDYRDRTDVSEVPRTTNTPEPQSDWRISRVVHEGFRLQTGHEPVIVEPAVVEIFRYTA